MKTLERDPHWRCYTVLFTLNIYETICAIWYHLYNFKNLKNTHEGVLLLACNFA